MARLLPMVLAVVLAGCAAAQTESPNGADAPRRVHHLVVVWLKQPGEESLRQRYIDESKALAKLPGVLAYDAGTPARIQRGHASSALDESYDVAITGVFENQPAFEAFLRHPEYTRVAREVLRPLVERYRVYDFVER